jgi:hypothetical protein
MEKSIFKYFDDFLSRLRPNDKVKFISDKGEYEGIVVRNLLGNGVEIKDPKSNDEYEIYDNSYKNGVLKLKSKKLNIKLNIIKIIASRGGNEILEFDPKANIPTPEKETKKETKKEEKKEYEIELSDLKDELLEKLKNVKQGNELVISYEDNKGRSNNVYLYILQKSSSEIVLLPAKDPNTYSEIIKSVYDKILKNKNKDDDEDKKAIHLRGGSFYNDEENKDKENEDNDLIIDYLTIKLPDPFLITPKGIVLQLIAVGKNFRTLINITDVFDIEDTKPKHEYYQLTYKDMLKTKELKDAFSKGGLGIIKGKEILSKYLGKTKKVLKDDDLIIGMRVNFIFYGEPIKPNINFSLEPGENYVGTAVTKRVVKVSGPTGNYFYIELKEKVKGLEDSWKVDVYYQKVFQGRTSRTYMGDGYIKIYSKRD